MSDLRAPFPYFGGKSVVARKIWSGFGQISHYIEPFFGSGAVLLARPGYDSAIHTETVNDKDGFVANVWRSIRYSPDETAEWCDWPVNHADLIARRKVLLANEARLIDGLSSDDEWHDPKIAGYWIWAASCWIGSGLTRPNAIPNVTDKGTGVHKHTVGQRPCLSYKGTGVHKHTVGQSPHLSHKGNGVHAIKSQSIYDWINHLSYRLRRVRVVCGDWTRVCGGNWQDKLGSVGFYFDPPYGIEDRDTTIYRHDSVDVAKDVMAWCVKRGAIPGYKIIISGYEEYLDLVDHHGWTFEKWKANGGYSNTGKISNINRERETIYYSPGCTPAKTHKQESLF